MQTRFKGYNRPSACPYSKTKVDDLRQHKCPVLCKLVCVKMCVQQDIRSSDLETHRTSAVSKPANPKRDNTVEPQEASTKEHASKEPK